MIIKGKKDRSSFPVWIIFSLLLAALFFALMTTSTGSKWSSERDTPNIFCDAEIREGQLFISGEREFLNGETQSGDQARSGKHSSLTNANQRQGMQYELSYPDSGRVYRVSVWRYAQDGKDGFLVVRSRDGETINVSTNTHTTYDKNWWFKLELTFAVPSDTLINTIDILVENRGDQNIYFDDLEIIEISGGSGSPVKHSYFNKNIHLIIEPAAQDRLNRMRENAQTTGVFIQGEDSEVPAAIRGKETNQEISLRYKGDWLDHILGGQPSYRVNCKSAETWNGLQSFSIQHPKTRGYLREWIYHDLLNYVDVLSPRYDFLEVQINDQSPKVYALEEHFTKYLVESQKRREGPIIKLSEDHYWEGMARHFDVNKGLAPASNKERALWTSRIEAFKAKRTYSDTTLRAQFQIAQNLILQFKYGLKSTSEIFDIDKLAKFMAISEVCLAHHSLTWHNQRFYYNPVIGLLEPIGFDCSVLGDAIGAFTKPLYAQGVYTKPPYSSEPIHSIFKDRDFLIKYFNYLDVYSKPDFIDTYLALRDREIKKRSTYLDKSKAGYSYDRAELIDRAKKIQIELKPYENAVNTYAIGSEGDSIQVEIANTHSLPVEVTWNKRNTANTILVLPQRTDRLPSYTNLSIPSFINTLYYRLPGQDEWLPSTITPVATPKNESPRGMLFSENGLADTSLFRVENNKATIKPGFHEIRKNIVIPEGYVLHILPGTSMHFLGEGKLISQSPLIAKGSQELPITISGDGNNGSITVLQAESPSELQFVTFENQNTLKYEGWNLTGAVTFYESDVHINRCRFMNNRCEDALNIIRADFDIRHSEFINTYSDAFDADFCTGKLTHSVFINTANDAVDFSTSQVYIEDCIMKQIGDKAISAGEQATISAKNIEVEQANIAFASKDKSLLELTDVSIKSCKKGFTAYQKKPEFGPATIKVKRYTEEDVDNLFLIEENSKLIN